jgi:hypothetical protein
MQQQSALNYYYLPRPKESTAQSADHIIRHFALSRPGHNYVPAANIEKTKYNCTAAAIGNY